MWGLLVFFQILLDNGKFCLKFFLFKQAEVPPGMTDCLPEATGSIKSVLSFQM